MLTAATRIVCISPSTDGIVGARAVLATTPPPGHAGGRRKRCLMPDRFPEVIADEEALDELLSEPTPLAVETLSRLDGDLLLLGVGGKMGPTLARMARRATDEAGVRRRVLGASRF